VTKGKRKKRTKWPKPFYRASGVTLPNEVQGSKGALEASKKTCFLENQIEIARKKKVGKRKGGTREKNRDIKRGLQRKRRSQPAG